MFLKNYLKKNFLTPLTHRTGLPSSTCQDQCRVFTKVSHGSVEATLSGLIRKHVSVILFGAHTQNEESHMSFFGTHPYKQAFSL